MAKKKQPLQWYVYCENINGKRIEPFNVFDHGSFLEDTKKNYKKNKNSFDAFCEQLKRDAQYYFWSNCNYEIILSNWPPSKQEPIKEKIDVFDQLNLNWDYFVQYTWNWFNNK